MSRLVFIDDEPQILQCYLEEMRHYFPDHETVVFENPNEAIDFLESHSADLVFTDAKMPKLTGFQVAKRLKASEFPGRVFMISGYAGEYTKQDLENVGIVDLFAKPIDFDQLLELITRELAAIKKPA